MPVEDSLAASVPLEAIAADAVALVAAFRQLGSAAAQNLSLEQSRANYVKTCQANGLAPLAMSSVHDVQLPGPGPTATLRVYRPLGADLTSALPLILFIHGGGWVVGDLDSHDPLCRYLAQHCNAAVVAVGYRCAPEYPFPAPLEDCRDVLGYIVEHHQRLHIDLQRSVIIGDSAGGNLATVLANDRRYRPTGFKFAAQALLYPVTDLSRESQSYVRITSGFSLVADSMRRFAGLYTQGTTHRADPRLSPLLNGDSGRQCELFIVTCGLDPLCDEGIAYAAKASREGTRVIHHHLPEHMHGIFTAAGKVATAERMLEQACAFIRSAQAQTLA